MPELLLVKDQDPQECTTDQVVMPHHLLLQCPEPQNRYILLLIRVRSVSYMD